MKRKRPTIDDLDHQTPGPSNRTNDLRSTSLEPKDDQEDVAVRSEPHGQAFLSRVDALEQLVFEKFDTLVPDWKTEDLAAIYARFRSSLCSEEGIKTFINVFENTTVEDVMSLIDTMKSVIDQAENWRFRFDEFLAEPSDYTDDLLPNSTVAGQKLTSIFSQVNSRRRTRTANSERLKEAIQSLTEDPPPVKKYRASTNLFSPACQETNPVNYSNIYQFLSEASIIKMPKQPLNPSEAAILLNIFEEVQEFADTHFDSHVAYFRQLLRDVQTMTHSDLSLLRLPSMDEFGKMQWNTLGLPDQLIDLSAAVNPRSRVESSVRVEPTNSPVPDVNEDRS